MSVRTGGDRLLEKRMLDFYDKAGLLMILSDGSLSQLEADKVYGRCVSLGVIFWLGFVLSVFSSAGHAQTGSGGERIAGKDEQGQVLGFYKESHALLIGMSRYTAGWPKLESVPQELELLEATLTRQGFNVVKLLNLPSYQLKQAIAEFIDKYGYDPDNRLLFYFSGHGYTRGRGSKGYFVPADAPHPLHDDLGFLRKALSMPQILAWSRSLHAKHVLFLFDSCFSASVFKAKSITVPPAPINQLTAEPVRQFITSCRAGEWLPQKSVFAQAVVEALRYGVGDLNADGYVTGRELGLYLQKEVPKHGDQTPQFGTSMDYKLSRGDFVFVVRPEYAYSVTQ